LRPTAVTGQQRGVECLGQRNIGGVIGRQIASQIPNAGQKEIALISPQWKGRQVGESRTAALVVDVAVCGITPYHLCHFHINQMWRVQRLTGGKQPVFHGFLPSACAEGPRAKPKRRRRSHAVALEADRCTRRQGRVGFRPAAQAHPQFVNRRAFRHLANLAQQ